MRIVNALPWLLLAWPVLADPPKIQALHQTTVSFAQHLVGGAGVAVGSPETNELIPENVLVSDATIAGDDAVLEQFLRENHSRTIAEEMIESYRRSRGRLQRLTATETGHAKIVRLDQFVGPPQDYKWEELGRAYPQVRVIVRMSEPAVDSMGTFAVVRYEVVTRRGFAWGVLQEFERQPDGAWLPKMGLAGNIGGPLADRAPNVAAPD